MAITKIKGSVVGNVLDNISALLSADPSGEYSILGYHTAGDGGGGEFYYDASMSQTLHNGGTIISKDAVFPSDWTNQTQVATWFAPGISTGCWVRIYSGEVNVLWFGAINTGTDATANNSAIQACINYLENLSVSSPIGNITGGSMYFPEGVYLFSNGLVIDANNIRMTGAGSSSMLYYSGTGTAISTSTTLRFNCEVSDLSILLTDSAKGIDFTYFSFSEFKNLRVEVRAANSTCIYGAGDNAGTGPYFNNFTNITLVGRNIPSTYPNQYGVVLDSTPGAFLADGPNANNFANFNRVVGLSIAFDIRSGNANMFNNIQCEQIQDYVFRFNARDPDFSGTATSGGTNSLTDTGETFTLMGSGGTLKVTGGTNSGQFARIAINVAASSTLTLNKNLPLAIDATSTYEVYRTKALGNKVSNLRVEGKSTALLASFEPGAQQNRINNIHVTSLAGTYFTNSTGMFDNVCGDDLVRLDYYASNIAASSTINLTPINQSAEGGLALGEVYYLDGVIVTGNRHTAGSVDVKVYRTGSLIKTITGALTGSRLSAAIEPDVNPDTTNNLFNPEDRASVTVDTDSSWAVSGTADLSVSLLFRCIR